MIAPSPFFRQHHAVEAPCVDDRNFRQSYRVLPKLEQLFLDHAISRPVFDAAVMFRIAAETVVSEDYPSSSMIYTDNNRGHLDHTHNHRVDARRRLRIIRAALGSDDHQLLEQHVVKDWDWREMARRRHVHPKTVRRWTIAALNRLASIPMS